MKHLQSDTPYKPGIAREGIFMVAVPVLLSTLLLLWVGQAWMEEGKIAYQGRKDFEAAAHGATAMTLLGKAMMGRFRKDFSPASGRQYLEAANKEIALCKAAIRESEIPQTGILTIVDRLTQLSNEEASGLQKHSFSFDTATVANFLDVSQGFNQCAYVIAVSQSLQEAIDAPLLKKWVSQDLARQYLLDTILFLFCAILAMAVFLTVRFLRTLVNRINTLMRNSQLVGRRDGFLEQVPGIDELAYLNSVLIAADSQLKEAEEDRKSILEMVAHDMRSPLMASQITLQLVEELTRDKLPQKAKLQLLLAQGSLKSVLVFIEDLLGVEKAEAESAGTASVIEDLPAFSRSRRGIGLLQLRIAQKVGLIVLLPLAIQATMLLSIAAGIENTQHLENVSRSKNRVAATLMNGADCLLLAESCLVKYLVTSDQVFEQRARADVAKFRKWIKGTARYITGADDKRIFADMDKAFNLELTRIENSMSTPDPDPAVNFARVKKSIDSTANPVFKFDKPGSDNQPILIQDNPDSISNQTKGQETLMAELVEKENNQRIFVQHALFLFVPINILIALLLILAFTRGVTRRLDLIVGHAEQLPKRMPIMDTVAGEDELSYLDSILQQTCASLIESQERRREMMQLIANEMRSPMIATLSAIEALSGLPDEAMPPVARKYMPSALKNIDRVLVLLNDLLTLDTIEGGRLELNLGPTEVRKIADEAISALASVAATRGIVLANECASSSIKVDQGRIVQVLINFISNAIKFSPDNSVISLISKQTRDSVAIGVKDQGPGMDQKTADRVFDKFFQAEGKKKSEGFGLGLAICKLIVESHGGAAYVETAPGKGAVFWISIPLLSNI